MNKYELKAEKVLEYIVESGINAGWIDNEILEKMGVYDKEIAEKIIYLLYIKGILDRSSVQDLAGIYYKLTQKAEKNIEEIRNKRGIGECSTN